MPNLIIQAQDVLIPLSKSLPGPGGTPPTRPKKAENFGFSTFFPDFFAFRSALEKRRRKNMEKSEKNEDFGLPKPIQNPPKILSKSRSQKTCNFSTIFRKFCLFSALCVFSAECKNLRKNCGFVEFRAYQQRAIVVGHIDEKMSKKPTENPPETRSEPSKNRCRKRAVF